MNRNRIGHNATGQNRSRNGVGQNSLGQNNIEFKQNKNRKGK